MSESCLSKNALPLTSDGSNSATSYTSNALVTYTCRISCVFGRDATAMPPSSVQTAATAAAAAAAALAAGCNTTTTSSTSNITAAAAPACHTHYATTTCDRQAGGQQASAAAAAGCPGGCGGGYWWLQHHPQAEAFVSEIRDIMHDSRLLCGPPHCHCHCCCWPLRQQRLPAWVGLKRSSTEHCKTSALWRTCMYTDSTTHRRHGQHVNSEAR